MLKDLKCRACCVVVTLAGFSEPGEMGADAAVLIGAALLNAAARAIWPSLLLRWRDRHHQLPSWRPSVDLKPARSRRSSPNSQEHDHAYP
jgi:hypothetical protein